MKANQPLFSMIGLLLLMLGTQICTAQNGYYFLTDQGLSIWKEPFNGWKEIGDAQVLAQAPDTLTLSEGIGMVSFSPKQGPSFLISSFEHGDCKLYAEVLLPHKGKAGLLLQGRYEIILSDSALTSEGAPDLLTFGAIAQRKRSDSLVEGHIPLRNAFTQKGKWQTIEIFFRAPRFGEKGIKTEYAKVWVKVNGITVQNGIQLFNVTAGSQSKAERLTGPMVFAGKESGVAFRNVSLKRLKMKRDYYPY